MRHQVWVGYHGEDARAGIERAWEKEELLILSSPSHATVLPPFLEQLRKGQKVRPFPEPPIFGLLSSGTEGRKLILYGRSCLSASMGGIFSFFDADRIDSIFSYPQPYHVFGLVLGYLYPYLNGKKRYDLEGPYGAIQHETWMEAASAGMVTLGTPTHFLDLMESVRSRGRQKSILPSYSAIIGGAAVTRELWLQVQDKLRIAAPSIGYGASELSPGATHLSPGKEPKQDGEIGIPLPGVGFEPQDSGGVLVSGKNVCLAVVTENSCVFPTQIRLKDNVVRSEDGGFLFAHRTDLLLNRGGEKFSLEEIERWFAEKCSISCVAVAVAHPRLGFELALVVNKRDVPLCKESYPRLRTHWGRSFSSDLVVGVEVIPKGANAKVDRQECQKVAEAEFGILAR